jgi:pimeloyl-ACP methyl ester carboxylesterase
MSNKRRAFSPFFLPNAPAEYIKSFLDLQPVSATAETAVMARMAVNDIDIVNLLPRISTPTLVFHCLRDQLVPFEQGRLLATAIPNARFVPLESDNHALLSHEPAWAKMMDEMEALLADV